MGEIEYIMQQEDIVQIDGLLLRRSMLGMLGRSSKKGLDELGQVIGGVRGWNDQLIKEEVERTVEILKSKHRINFDHSRSEGEE
jgi:glycerol-3-phosphate dehydrogenase